jgi:hypothetical protein
VLLRVVLAAAAAVLAAGCSGQSCDRLGPLQAERDEARAAWSALVATGQAGEDELLTAHDELHALEQRTHELERSCERG